MAYFNRTGGAYGPGATHGPGPGFGQQHHAMPPPRNNFGWAGRLASMIQKHVDRKAERHIDYVVGLGAQLDQERQYHMTGAYGRAAADYGQHHVPNDHISPQVRQMFDHMQRRIDSLEHQLQTTLQTILSRLPPEPARPFAAPAPGVHDHEMPQPTHAAPNRDPRTEAERHPPPLPPRPEARVDAAQVRVLGTALSRSDIERWRDKLPTRSSEYDPLFENGSERSDDTASAAPHRSPEETARRAVRRKPVPQAGAGTFPGQAAGNEAAVRRKPVPQAGAGTFPGQAAGSPDALGDLDEIRATAERVRDSIKAKLALTKDGREAALRILR